MRQTTQEQLFMCQLHIQSLKNWIHMLQNLRCNLLSHPIDSYIQDHQRHLLNLLDERAAESYHELASLLRTSYQLENLLQHSE